MDFLERRWLLGNPIAAAALGLAIVAMGVTAAFDDSARWVLLIAAAVFLLLLTGAMTTRVDGGTVTITYRPIWRRRIEISAIQSARLIPYKWTDYGGWGIRYGQRAWAYSVWEKDAVRLQLEGTDVVIGSKRAQELLDALRTQGVSAVDTTDETPA